jgi:hypothetical protein
VIKRYEKYALEGMICDDLAFALIGTVLDVFPVFGPLLAPLESSTTSNANLRLETVLGLWSWSHSPSLIRPGCLGLAK